MTQKFKRHRQAVDHEAVLRARESGMTIAAIAEHLGCGTTTVFYHLHNDYRIRQCSDRRARRKDGPAPLAKEFDLAALRASWGDDGGDPWIEDRTVWAQKPTERRDGGRIGNKQPKPERCKSKPVTRLSAIHAYLDGDRGALRVYLDNVG